nr:hypothetical protein BaRGS_019738 [Batillaria attramentaria]
METGDFVTCISQVLIHSCTVAKKRRTRNRCEALNGIQLTAEVKDLKRQLASSQGTITCPPTTRAQKVAFSVRFKNDDLYNGIHLGQRSTLKFDDVVINLGDGYSPLTGIFTAPVAGLYVFSLTSMTTIGRDPAQLAIVMQGTDLARTWGRGKHDVDDQGTKTVPAYLKKGDQVWVAQRLGDAVRGAWWTAFSGFLVQAD